MIKLMTDTIMPRINVKINWELLVPAVTSLMLMAIIVKTIDNIENPRPMYYFPPAAPAPKKRRDFSESTKEDAKLRQGFVCNLCKKPPELWEYHHRDRDRSNNRPSNCEGLCPICHAKKTRKIKKFY